MGLLSILSFFIFAAEGSGANIVLLFSALGGLSGLAAVLTVYITHRANTKKAVQDDKSVAITELEKAVPGMGEIIKEWQNIVHHLQDENVRLKTELHDCREESGVTHHD